MGTVTGEEPKTTIVWDTCDVLDAAVKEHMVALGKDDEDTEEEVREVLAEDEDLLRISYEDHLEDLQAALDGFNPDNLPYFVEVNNFGWLRMSGTCVISDEITAGKLLHKILPNCECSYTIRVYDDRITIQNSHHDNPTGTEMYTITLMGLCDVCGLPIPPDGEEIDTKFTVCRGCE